jgi:hypothetical protein
MTMRKTFTALCAMLAVGLTLHAADINKGYTFQPGEKNVTHTKLNNLVEAATINTSFFTGKSAITNAEGADILLLYSPTLAGFRKISWNSLLLGNSAFITSQTEDTSPATNDHVLIVSAADATYKKVPLSSLALPNTGLIGDLPLLASSNFLQSAFVPILNDGTNNKVPISTLLEGWSLYPFTNRTATTTQTNEDKLLIWDSAAGVNKTITVQAWFTNPPASSTFTNEDSFLYWSSVTNATDGTNGRLKRLTLSGLWTNPPITTVWTNTDTIPIWSTATNGPGGTNPTMARVAISSLLQTRTFTTAEFLLPGPNNTTNLAHNLPGTPQSVFWVLVCKTADLNYAIEDELAFTSFVDTGGNGRNPFVPGANTTNIFVLQGDNARTRNKTTANLENITAASWRIKAYATWQPN